MTNLTEVNSNLKWTPPIWKNGDIHNYIVEYVSFKPTQLEQNGTKNVTVSSKESLPNITFETLGLIGGAEYNISIQAENNNGAGPHTNILIKTPIKGTLFGTAYYILNGVMWASIPCLIHPVIIV